MALTIVEAAKLAANNGEEKRAGVIMAFAEASQVLRAMPILTIQGNSYAFTRQAILPTVAFRGVGGTFTPNEGVFETKTEVLKLVGGEVDVDRFLLDTGGTTLRTEHERMKSVAMAQTIGLKLFKGDASIGGSTEFNGIQTRTGGSSPSAIAGRVYDGGNAALSMKKLDEAIDSVDRNIGQRVIVMNQAMRRNITTFLRGSGTAVEMQRDAFGDQIQQYAGLPILEADQLGDQAGIAFDENSNSSTSVYVLSLGLSGLHMIQSTSGISVQDLGVLPTAPVMRTRVEWYVSLADVHPRCIARIYNISNATAAA